MFQQAYMHNGSQLQQRNIDLDRLTSVRVITKNVLSLLFCLIVYAQGGPKIGTIFVRLNFYQILTDFRNYFTVEIRRKFVIILSLKIPPHLSKCVATLPCEISSDCRSVSLTEPLVSGVAGLNASSSSKADTLNNWCKNCRMWQLL